MCVVSMVGDHYDSWLPKRYPEAFTSWPDIPAVHDYVTKSEFEALKRTVEEMKELLKRAKEYDERNNEPECEIEEKMDLLRRVAEAVGVNLDDVLGSKPAN